jgi:hypothetical protein
MSFKALAAVFKLEHPALTSTHQAVLVSLAWHFNDDEGVARPKAETIARESRCHRVTAVRILRELKQWGLIAPQGTTARGVVRYALSIDGLQAQPDSSEAQPDSSARLHRQDSDSSAALPQVLHMATPGVAHGYPISNRKGIEKREEQQADSTAASPLPSGEAAAQPSAPVTARGPQSGFTATAQLVQALVQRSESKPDPEPQPTGPGNGSRGQPKRNAVRAANGRPVAAAPASLRVLHDRHQQLQRVAAQTFDALGLYADPLALEADFNQRVETLGIELGAVDVMDYLWKAKRERRTQAYAHAVS